MTKKIKNRPPKRKIRSGRGALLVLSIVFVSSAGIRIYSGSGAAFAKELMSAPIENVAMEAGDAPEICISPSDTMSLVHTLKEREKRVEEQEFLLAQKWKAVEIATLEIEENFAALEAAEKRLQATMTRSQTAAEEDLSKLTAVYEAMKPKEAAALFEAMSPEFAAGFLARMRSDAAGPILAGLPPETAYTISVILAGRNANAPSE